MRKTSFLIVVVLVASCVCQAQKQTNKADAKGSCNASVAGANNQVRIECPGLSKEQMQEYSKVLDLMVKNQLPASKVMKDLEDIKNGVDNCTKVAAGWRLTKEQKENLVKANNAISRLVFGNNGGI